MKIIHVSNPRWLNEAHTCVMVEVEFEGQEVMPFQASKGVDGIAGEIFERVAALEFGTIAAFKPLIADTHAPDVPQSITPIQFRRILRRKGLFDAVKELLQAAGEDAMDEFEYATEIRRDDPLLLGMAEQLMLNPIAVDDMFRLAVS